MTWSLYSSIPEAFLAAPGPPEGKSTMIHHLIDLRTGKNAWKGAREDYADCSRISDVQFPLQVLG